MSGRDPLMRKQTIWQIPACGEPDHVYTIGSVNSHYRSGYRTGVQLPTIVARNCGIECLSTIV